MTSNDDILDLVGQVYEAGINENKWPRALHRICHAVGGQSALFFSPALSAQKVGFSVLHNIEAATMEKYSEHYIEHDLWCRQGLLLPTGQVTTSEGLVSSRHFKSSIFYNEFLQSHEIFHLLSVILLRSGEQSTNLSFYRSRRSADFEGDAQRLLSLLVPHLKRATQLHWRIGALEKRIEADLAALDRLSSAVFLVDGEGRVLFANRAGEALLRSRDGICLRSGRLAAASAASTDLLQKLIAGAARTALGIAFKNSGGTLSVARSSEKRPLMALVSPLGRSEVARPARRAAAIVFVNDPELEPKAPSEALAWAYGLTAAEARLASALVTGTKLKDYADIHAISVNTARWTLKQVFRKTDTRSQAELVRLFLQFNGVRLG